MAVWIGSGGSGAALGRIYPQDAGSLRPSNRSAPISLSCLSPASLSCLAPCISARAQAGRGELPRRRAVVAWATSCHDLAAMGLFSCGVAQSWAWAVGTPDRTWWWPRVAAEALAPTPAPDLRRDGRRSNTVEVVPAAGGARGGQQMLRRRMEQGRGTPSSHPRPRL
jgi:hypothetical protein